MSFSLSLHAHTFSFFHRWPAEYGLQLGYDLGTRGQNRLPRKFPVIGSSSFDFPMQCVSDLHVQKRQFLPQKQQMNQDEAQKSGAFTRMQRLGGIRTYNLPASTTWPGAEFAWEISDAQLKCARVTRSTFLQMI